jgi:NADPH:quinone reductase-like Zn-dependent oxidoreductase
MAKTYQRRGLIFNAPKEIAIQESELPHPDPDQVLVKTLLSGISPGTEMLIYRGQFPPDLAVDANIPDLAGGFRYPLKYGYSVVGEVVASGSTVDPAWMGKLVFAFHPHESHFTAAPEVLHPLPAGIRLDDAVFLPNMETAVNFLLDSRPMLGERAVVLVRVS